MLEVNELLLYYFRSLLLSDDLLFHALLHTQVKVLHFELIVFKPSFFNGFVLLFSTFLQIYLRLAFLDHIAKLHSCVESLNLILAIMHLLVCLL